MSDNLGHGGMLHEPMIDVILSIRYSTCNCDSPEMELTARSYFRNARLLLSRLNASPRLD